MKRRILATLMSAATIATTLAGCNSSAPAPAPSSGGDPAPAATQAPASGEGQEIQWMFWDDLNATSDLISLGYKDTIERFNKDYEGKYHVTAAHVCDVGHALVHGLEPQFLSLLAELLIQIRS